MREQGGGTIIGISSAFGIRSVPFYVAYCMAKQGNTALYEGLRVEERIAGSGVEVSTILPATVNTPFYDVVPSFVRSPRAARPPIVPPVYQPSAVAEAIVYAAEHPRRRIFIGVAGPLAGLQRISPRALDAVARVATGAFVRNREAGPEDGPDNLHTPLPGPGRTLGKARAAWPSSRYTRTVGFHPGLARAAGLAAALLLARRRRAR